MTEKRFRKVMGFIQDITCEGGDVVGMMDLTEIEDMLNRLNDENMRLKSENQRVSEQKYIYKQDWKHLCIDKELLDSENEQLKQKIKSIKEILNEDIGYIESLRKIEEALK